MPLRAKGEPDSILLIDDHVIVRDGCRTLLENADYVVAGEASTGEEGYSLFVSLKPTVVIVDLSMEGWGGLQTINRILAHAPGTRIIVFTMHTDMVYANHALAAGAVGYVTKKSSPGTLLESVRRVVAGKRYLSPDVAEALALAKISNTRQPLAVLSVREFDILQLLLNGKNVSDIARIVSISSKSVTNCLIRIKRKLGARSTLDLMRIAIAIDDKIQHHKSMGACVDDDIHAAG
jgi:DNA-binding NarL/FixJ family response regulator